MDSSIKNCKAKLELLTNTDVSLIVPKGIRVGKFHLLLRYARAKNTEKSKCLIKIFIVSNIYIQN